MANPQKEDGNTGINNEVLMHLIGSGLNGTELSLCLFIIRKTWGFNKLSDEISLSQFMNHIPATKPSICKALANLQLVKIIELVKKGKSKIASNEWKFNKDYDSWQLVKKNKLVKNRKSTSKENFTHNIKVQNKSKKDISNEISKKKNFSPPSLEDVMAYCQERSNRVDPEKWMDHYTSNGWMVGKNKMKDWKAAVRTWERSNFETKRKLDINCHDAPGYTYMDGWPEY